MKRNIWILPALMTAFLSGIYVLPHAGSMADSAIRMELPDVEGAWNFRSEPASEAELKALATDTKFSKAICLRARPGEVNDEGQLVPDRIDLSIVMSGADLNNSIHRPERCMPAQGHTILSSQDRKVTLPDGRELKVRRLLSTQQLSNYRFDCITYYFFVGHDQVTASHLDRTRIDMQDRLLLGRDQHWAYVSMSMWYGAVPWIEPKVSEAEADKKLEEFLLNFAEKQINWSQIKS